MRDKIHIVNTPDPIVREGELQQAICKAMIPKARHLVIVPDVRGASVGLIADTYGFQMCRECPMIDPVFPYVYFDVTESEWLRLTRGVAEYAEVG